MSCADLGFPADRIASAILGLLETSKGSFVPVDEIEAPANSLVSMYSDALKAEKRTVNTIR